MGCDPQSNWLIVIRLIKKLESIVSGKGEEERARKEKRRREQERGNFRAVKSRLALGSERGNFWVSCPDLTSSPNPNPKTKGLTPPRHSRWVESEYGGEPKGSGGRRTGGLTISRSRRKPGVREQMEGRGNGSTG